MRTRAYFLLFAFCAMLISAPAWARDLSTNAQFASPNKIANINLKPGQYRFVANESTGGVKVLRQGKLVARVKGKWVNLTSKSPYAAVESTRNNIQEILFSGQKRAIKFPA